MLLVSCADSLKNENAEPAVAAMEIHLRLGMEYLAEGNLSAAHYNFEKVLRAYPQDYRAQLAMAVYEQRIGENSAAEKRYLHAMQLAPVNGIVLNSYGVFLCNSGRYTAAQQQFSIAASLPDYAQVADSLENAGYCFLKANRDRDAKTLLTRALRYDSAKGASLLAEAERQLQQGKYARVQLLLDVYQTILPVSAGSLWLQIRSAALMNRQDRVQHYGRQLARDFPQSKQYQHFLAHEY